MVARKRALIAKLVLADDDGPLAGTLGSDDGAERPFTGWMELAAAIEAWRAGARAPAAARVPRRDEDR